MSNKKIFKILGIILTIILAILVIYFIAIHFNGFLNKNNSMTREEIIELLEKGKNYPNYYYSSEDRILFFNINENKTEYFIKDNVIKCMNNGIFSSLTDYNNDEKISLLEINGKKYACISSLDTFEKNLDSQNGFDYSVISEEEIFNTNFEYMGEKNYKERTTILVRTWNKDGLKVNSTIFYIDKDTGLVMRRIDYTTLGLIKIDCNRNVKLDVVTDNDIEKPNLEGYEIIENK